jgi:hypothetical protein
MIMMMMRSEIKDHFRAPLRHHTKDKIKQKNNCEEALEIKKSFSSSMHTQKQIK